MECTPPTGPAREPHGAQVRYDALIALAAKWNRATTIEEAASALVTGVKFVLSIDVWRFALIEGSGVIVVEGSLETTSVAQAKLADLSELERRLLATTVPVLFDAEELGMRRPELPAGVRGRAINALYGMAASGPSSAAEHVLLVGARATLSSLDVKFAGLLGGLFADKVRQLRAEDRLRERDSRIYSDLCESRAFQRSLLPKLDTVPGLEIATVFEPIEMVGGDVYDITVLPDGRLRLFLVDATGHGLQAAMRTMVLISEYNNLKYRAESPADLLRALNRRVFEHATPLELLSPAVCADIDLGRERRCVIANAGAPPTLLASPVGSGLLEAGGSMLLGMHPSMVIEEITTTLEPGDRLLFATDGLFDQRSPTNGALGYEPAQYALATGDTLPQCAALLRQLFDDHRAGAQRDDDVTALFIGVVPHR